MSAGEDSRSGSGEERAAAEVEGGAPTDDRGTCTPCRGTGKVISSLGGQQHSVTCPWCGGTGRFRPGRDAQDSAAERDTRDPAAERQAPPAQDDR